MVLWSYRLPPPPWRHIMSVRCAQHHMSTVLLHHSVVLIGRTHEDSPCLTYTVQRMSSYKTAACLHSTVLQVPLPRRRVRVARRRPRQRQLEQLQQQHGQWQRQQQHTRKSASGSDGGGGHCSECKLVCAAASVRQVRVGCCVPV